MAVLYRKYRPQTFAEVVGQSHIVRTLQNQVAAGSVAHAYLFTGGRGVGKTSIARILAKAVNCEKSSNKKNSDACGKCSVCKQIEDGSFIDLVEIDAASNTGVDNIRDLIDHVKFSPAVGKYKIFIIDEVHMLSKGAFNALLKTLEEPPKHAIFILATTEIQKVPPTIISRTQRFDFRSMTHAELVVHMRSVIESEKMKLSDEVLDLVAAGAGGSVRDSLSLLDKVLSLGSSPDISDVQVLLGVTDISLSEDLFELIVRAESFAIPAFFERLLEKGTDMTVFNKDFLQYLRAVLVFKAAQVKPGYAEHSIAKMEKFVAEVTLQEIILVARLFLKSYKDIAGSVSTDIPLLLAALEACSRKTVVKNIVKEDVVVSTIQPRVSVEVTPKPLLAEADVPAWGFTQVLEPSAVLPEASVEMEDSVIEDADVTVLTSEIQPFWNSIVHEVKTQNGPVGNIIKNASFEGVSGGRVWVGVEFLFHKQNLENQKNIKIICDVIEKVTRKKLGFGAKIVKRESVVTTSAEALGDALKIFGGEVVE